MVKTRIIKVKNIERTQTSFKGTQSIRKRFICSAFYY